MAEHFKVGDRVQWNSEAGLVRGTIVRIHTGDFDYKGYTHYAGPDAPQYEIKSGKTDHIAGAQGFSAHEAERLKGPAAATQPKEGDDDRPPSIGHANGGSGPSQRRADPG